MALSPGWRFGATALPSPLFAPLVAPLLAPLFCGLLALASAAPVHAASPAWTLTGEVVRVLDGDTVTLLDTEQHEHRIRLASIDAPEKRQPWGQAARQALAEQSWRRSATAQCRKRDRYGREVCTLSVDGADLGMALLRAGFAWHYLDYLREQTREQAQAYAEAQMAAREAGRGLWADAEPTPPWAWRRESRQRSSSHSGGADVARLVPSAAPGQ
jgi:endonuclease YncB( thermonuclease family)